MASFESQRVLSGFRASSDGDKSFSIPTFCIISFVVLLGLTITVSTLVVIYYIRKRRHEQKMLDQIEHQRF